MLGNLLLWKRFKGNYIFMMQIAYLIVITAFIMALFAHSPLSYGLIFLLFGIAIDGFRNADLNLILEIAPEAKRPVYVAIHSTLSSIGLFFTIPGGYILQSYGYTTLYLTTLFMLAIGVLTTNKLKKLGV